MQIYEFQCRFCGAKERVELDPGKVADWQNGSLIQRVFPELSNERYHDGLHENHEEPPF